MSYVISEREPKARKNHQCDWCNLVINKGVKYYSYTCTFDGIQTGKFHLSCKKDAQFCADHRVCLSEYEEEREQSRKENRNQSTQRAR